MIERWAVLCATLAAGFPAMAQNSGDDAIDPCAGIALHVEQQLGMPGGVLRAISLTESAKWLPEQQRSVAWPWTVTSGSDHYYLADQSSAEDLVRKLHAEGRDNIDVGCMQINLRYHPEAFADLGAAFAPEANVGYAAAYLIQLRRRTHSWANAIAHYHSSDVERGRLYRKRVYRRWNEVRRDLAASLRVRRGRRHVTSAKVDLAGNVHAQRPVMTSRDIEGIVVLRGN